MTAANSHVILIHGLAAHRLVMQRLAWSLASSGYTVENWKYSSVRGSLPRLGQALRERLERLSGEAATEEIHLVTHSMGSIVARCALQPGSLPKLGRWVMLAPPNRGSHAARWLAPWLGWYCEPLIQLSDDPSSFVNQLAIPEGMEIGVIAAALDHVVRRASTPVPSQQEWIVLPGMHSMLPWRKETVERVRSFLETGQFWA